jgi:thiamine-monophosphate kinase
MASEFEIIARYFSRLGKESAHTRLAVGDDAAVVEVPPGQQLAVCIDTLVGGTHFPLDTDPADIGYKALTVNLSDLAAMAADPAWFQLSLTLPRADSEWLEGFATGLRDAAETFGVQLVGGDTCRGELAISIQAAGLVPAGCYLTRGGARRGDIVLVSGELGNAALGLAHRQGKIELPAATAKKCLRALNRPEPRLQLTPFLRQFASAAIDISDGLLGDLRHILEASGLGAEIDRAAIPVDAWIERRGTYEYALEAGDDYEICCTVGERHRSEIETWNRQHADCPLSAIGTISESGYRLHADSETIDLDRKQGYRHFG